MTEELKSLFYDFDTNTAFHLGINREATYRHVVIRLVRHDKEETFMTLGKDEVHRLQRALDHCLGMMEK